LNEGDESFRATAELRLVIPCPHQKSRPPIRILRLPPRSKYFACFGPPPLLSTESGEHFEQILTHFIAAIMPAGAIEQMWVYDIAVLVWE
jgi:hypothetical protein